MKLYRKLTDGIIESLIKDNDSWDTVSHENPSEDYLVHKSGNKVYIYSGSLVTSNDVRVDLPEAMKKEISEFTMLMKRSPRKFKERREALMILESAFIRQEANGE